jgi:pimeloyl-ACP methyl ester carboxylesterase
MAQHYIQLMQQVHPLTSAQAKGGYRLIGYSYGACIAFEMACQLQTRHGVAAVQRLVLLDGSVQYMQAYRRVYRQAYSLGVLMQLEFSSCTLMGTQSTCPRVNTPGQVQCGHRQSGKQSVVRVGNHVRPGYSIQFGTYIVDAR